MKLNKKLNQTESFIDKNFYILDVLGKSIIKNFNLSNIKAF